MPHDELAVLIRAAAQSKYWREEDARVLLTACAESGRSLASFAREWGLNRGRLKRWQRLLTVAQPAESMSAAAPVPMFHPVQVLVDKQRQGSELELVLRNGRRIIVPPSFDEATFERLLRIAESTSC